MTRGASLGQFLRREFWFAGVFESDSGTETSFVSGGADLIEFNHLRLLLNVKMTRYSQLAVSDVLFVTFGRVGCCGKSSGTSLEGLDGPKLRKHFSEWICGAMASVRWSCQFTVP